MKAPPFFRAYAHRHRYFDELYCIDLIMQDSAACYQTTWEALLFRLHFD
jgi:hypothetical protein